MEQKKMMNDAACQACETFRAMVFIDAVEGGIPTDIARTMSQVVSTAWQAGFYYAKNH